LYGILTAGLTFTFCMVLMLSMLWSKAKAFITDSQYETPIITNIFPVTKSMSEDFNDDPTLMILFMILCIFSSIIIGTLWPLSWLILIIYITLHSLRYYIRNKKKALKDSTTNNNDGV